jgi:APA family basic amino acid/polyamine antiporter
MHQLLEKVFHIDFPDYLTVPTLKAINHSADYVHFPHIFGLPVSVNLPAMLIIALLTMLLIKGISESTKVNNVIVALKLVIVLIFIFVGAFFVERSNWIPFAPNGWPGIFAGASLVFFAYIGFDALTTASEEVKNPGKDLPFAIIGSLLVCTVLYIIVTAILTGMIKYTQLNVPDPVAVALNFVGLKWAPANWLANYIVSVGAVIALTSTMLVFLMGQPRILFAMGRDGFLPPIFAKVHPKFHTPYIPTIISGTIVMLLAGFGDLDSVASLCNIGTLTAFIMVAVGIIILRKKCPESPRKFKVPYVPLFPILGILVCLILIAYLPKVAIIGFFVWMIIGLIIYFNYGIKHTYYKTSEDAVVCNIEEFNDDGIVK